MLGQRVNDTSVNATGNPRGRSVRGVRRLAQVALGLRKQIAEILCEELTVWEPMCDLQNKVSLQTQAESHRGLAGWVTGESFSAFHSSQD